MNKELELTIKDSEPCDGCEHYHEGPDGICVGCPCDRRPGQERVPDGCLASDHARGEHTPARPALPQSWRNIERPAVDGTGGIVLVQVGKAAPMVEGGQPIPSLVVIADYEIIQHHGDSWQESYRKTYVDDARDLVEAMIATLPGGTIDQILVNLLQRKASMLRVVDPKAR